MVKVSRDSSDGFLPEVSGPGCVAMAVHPQQGCRGLWTASHLQKNRCENSNPVACGAHFFPASHRVRFMASGVSWTVVGNARCGQEHGQEASQPPVIMRPSSCMRCVPIHARAHDRPPRLVRVCIVFLAGTFELADANCTVVVDADVCGL